MRWWILGMIACAPAGASNESGVALDYAAPAEELGHVRWTLGVDAALERSKLSAKPVLVLFDEVPGCSTVKGFGNGALTHPLLVEAVESLFEPVLVTNNTARDAAVCERFGEPQWNNPIVRVLGPDGSDAAPRFDGPYTEASFAKHLVSSLGKGAPTWLRGVSDELNAQARVETATYSMACFWSGESHLGTSPGVVGTRTGWQDGREVVEVRYDPSVVSHSQLTRHARAGGASPERVGTVRATPKDDRYRLRRTEWASIPMTPAQATKANAFLSKGQSPEGVFSPRQLERKGGPRGTLGASLDLRGALSPR